MELCKKPRVYLVGQTSVNLNVIQDFLKVEADAEGWWPGGKFAASDIMPEVGGRLCYMSFKGMMEGNGRKTNKSYLKNIKQVGHGSVLEHSNFSFIICGISRSLSHELVRHRAGCSYSQLSQRYVDFENSPEVVIPPEFVDNKAQANNFGKYMEGITEIYKDLIKNADDIVDSTATLMIRKRKRQSARSILPNAVSTKILVTMNARALRHFFELRGSEHADLEIRRLAIMMYEEVKHCNIFDDFYIEESEVVPVLKCKYGKV